METWRNLPAVAGRPRVVNRLDKPGPLAPDGAAAVVCQAIVKDFELGNGSSLRALDNVSFSLPAGGLTMLSGPSGCGKSTLLSIISGILKATSGEVSIFGTVAGRMKDRDQVAFRRQATGFVFQQYNLLAALSARENAAVPLIAAGWRRAEALAASDAVLTQLGMARFAGALPRQLSGGQQQRVAIARAMVHSPRLVLCDEPTAALDAANGRVLMQLLRAVALAPERAVIVVTHDSRIFEFADRIITMEDGRIKHLNHAAAMPTAASGF